MKDAQRSDHVPLLTLIDRLREGRFEIPDFQREFEWVPSDIQELMKSIFRDYYIGNLLLWKGPDQIFDSLSCERITGYDGERHRREHVVLDGQQRLSAMYYAFFAPDMPAPKRKNRYFYFIQIDKFQEEAYDAAFISDWKRASEIILDNPQEQYRKHMFPLSILGKGGWDFPYWFQGYDSFWREKMDIGEKDAEIHVKNGQDFGDYMRDLVQNYRISCIELQSELEISKICDIFAKINSTGKPLAIFHLMNALLTPKEIQLKHMWREAEPRLDFVDSDNMNVYVLQVMSILRQGYLSARYLYFLLPGYARPIRDPDGTRRSEIQVADKPEFIHLWDTAVSALERSIERLRHVQEFGAIHSKFLPYQAILPVFAALDEELGKITTSSRLSASVKFRYWYWASVFTQRYSGATESTAAIDYRDVLGWFASDGTEPSMITSFRENIGDLDLLSENRPQSAVYKGIINLLVLAGAKDWISGNAPIHDDLDDHHIVPQTWGKEHDLGNEIDTILNRTLLSAGTNRNIIRDRLPSEYLPELAEQSSEDTVRSILSSHLISPEAFNILMRNPFTPDDYREFLSERQQTLRETIGHLMSMDHLEYEPTLSELDDSIRDIELALRACIADSLAGDIHLLPSDPRIRADQQIEQYLKTNPGADQEQHSKTLMGKLEHFDLRGLQQVITNKSLWERFEPRFKTKELLNRHFDQLTGLRNPLAHSRPLGEVSRLEGEAAIKWFRAALGLED